MQPVCAWSKGQPWEHRQLTRCHLPEDSSVFFPSSHQLSEDSQLWATLVNPFPVNAGFLTGLILCRFCVDNLASVGSWVRWFCHIQTAMVHSSPSQFWLLQLLSLLVTAERSFSGEEWKLVFIFHFLKTGLCSPGWPETCYVSKDDPEFWILPLLLPKC